MSTSPLLSRRNFFKLGALGGHPLLDQCVPLGEFRMGAVEPLFHGILAHSAFTLCRSQCVELGCDILTFTRDRLLKCGLQINASLLDR